MEKKDHKRLAQFWMERAGHKLPKIDRQAYIYGSIEPDMNPLTYLHGFRTQQKFHGHNRENIKPTLLKMLEKDLQKPLSLRTCYRLGKCSHYIADCFTFPHNLAFEGTVKEHVRYDSELHDHWMNIMDTLSPTIVPRRIRFPDLADELDALHRAYRQAPHGIDQDCSYIFTATQILLETCLMPKLEEAPNYESIHRYRLVQSRN